MNTPTIEQLKDNVITAAREYYAATEAMLAHDHDKPFTNVYERAAVAQTAMQVAFEALDAERPT